MVEIKVNIMGMSILSFDNFPSIKPIKKPVKKSIKPFIPITGLNIISCNSPDIKPTILPTFFPLSKAIITVTINAVFGTTPNILK